MVPCLFVHLHGKEKSPFPLMEFTFLLKRKREGLPEACFLHSKYQTSVTSVAVIYANGDYKGLNYVNRVLFSDTLDEDGIGVVTSEFAKYQDWNQQKVTVQLLPKYFFHPWKSVLLGLDDQ